MDAAIALPALLKALHFAADKHRDQRRKGAEASPYVNHLIEVAELLTREGGVTDLMILQAVILHDTLEDTETTPTELDADFGAVVRRIVEEVSDDQTLTKEETVAAQQYPIEVFGQSFTVTSEKSEQHVQMVAAYVDRKMRDRARTSKTLMPLRVAIMTALDIAEEVFEQHP